MSTHETNRPDTPQAASAPPSDALPDDVVEVLPSDAPDNGPLVVGFCLDGRGGATELTWEQVRDGPCEGAVWVHLHFPNVEARRWLRHQPGVEEVVYEALVADETRPRAVAQGSGLMANLRGVNLNPGADPEDMVSIRIWLEPGRIITARRRQLSSAVDMRAAFQRGQGPETPAQLFVLLAERLADQTSDMVESLADQVDSLEAAAALDDPRPARRVLAECRRQAVALRRFIAPQRDALSRAGHERIAVLDDTDRLHLREIADRLTRVVEELDAARERAQVIQEEIASRMGEQLNRRIYVLSLVAGVFLPLSFLTGLFGINVGGIPGAENPNGFIWVAGLLAALLFSLAVLFRWVRWM
ncbi:MAG: zinc transporter ZntB [Nitrospirota bacterium]|nr:zinc transporter ZntB [Nitrospirota bacterium]